MDRRRLALGCVLVACAVLASCGPGGAQEHRAEDVRAAPVAPQAGLQPGERVSAFIHAYRGTGHTGLPDGGQQAALAPHCSARLRELMRAALRGQAAYIAKYPTDKPPLVEGDLVSSLFEGATGFRIGPVSIAGAQAAVQVDFEYATGTADPVRWHDRFLLVRDASGSWRVDDLEYQGGWDFAPKGRLSEALSATAAFH